MKQQFPQRTRILSWALAVGSVAFLIAAVGFDWTASAAEEPHIIPAPGEDERSVSGMQTAVLAGGCFWGIQGVFQHVTGVVSATSGYAGGSGASAHYETVSSGTTGHAESVRIVYDPKIITYGRLLQIYFSAAHDPTRLNRQGPDRGTQYRSAIFPQTDDQAMVAKTYISQLNKAGVYDAAIVTGIEAGKVFYPAEAYHQNFLTNNPTYPYILINDLPKIENLKRIFPNDYKSKPVLVTTVGSR